MRREAGAATVYDGPPRPGVFIPVWRSHLASSLDTIPVVPLLAAMGCGHDMVERHSHRRNSRFASSKRWKLWCRVATASDCFGPILRPSFWDPRESATEHSGDLSSRDVSVNAGAQAAMPQSCGGSPQYFRPSRC